jgi:hypothetical protein
MQFDEGKMAPEMTMLLMEHIQTQAIRTYAVAESCPSKSSSCPTMRPCAASRPNTRPAIEMTRTKTGASENAV